MNPALISILSGPLSALVRYGLASGTTYLIGKGVIPGPVIVDAIAFITGTVLPAIAGAATSTNAAAVTKVNTVVPGVVVVPSHEALSAGIEPVNPNDPTWADPNAR